MTSTDTTARTATIGQWKKNRTHLVTLPSSTVIEIEIPDLPHLIKTGVVPNELIDAAIGVAQGKKVTRDDIIQQTEFYDKLITLTVKNPAVTETDVREIPFEDKEMIVDLATRQRDLDAIGHHIGGLEKVKDFRTFRGISAGDEDGFGL